MQAKCSGRSTATATRQCRLASARRPSRSVICSAFLGSTTPPAARGGAASEASRVRWTGIKTSPQTSTGSGTGVVHALRSLLDGFLVSTASDHCTCEVRCEDHKKLETAADEVKAVLRLRSIRSSSQIPGGQPNVRSKRAEFENARLILQPISYAPRCDNHAIIVRSRCRLPWTAWKVRKVTASDINVALADGGLTTRLTHSHLRLCRCHRWRDRTLRHPYGGRS